MKMIVFGGSGFIGSHVVEQLVLSRQHDVTAVVRPSANAAFLESLGLRVVYDDLSSDAKLRQLIKGHEVVYNCIANTKMHQSLKQRYAVEVDIPRRLVRASADARRFIQLSTIHVYGFGHGVNPVLDENAVLYPSYSYNRAAIAREQEVKQGAEACGIEYTILRPSTTIGQRDSSFLPNYTKTVSKGYFPVFGDPLRSFDYVDARDIGRAMVWLAGQAQAANEVYLLKHDKISWMDFKAAMDAHYGRESKVLVLPQRLLATVAGLLEVIVPYRYDLPLTRFAIAATGQMSFNDDKIRQLGFQTEFGLAEMLEAALL